MGAHLIDGEFQSDKYPTTPRGKVPLSCKDRMAQELLWEYAQRRRSVDAEFADDLETALRMAGYAPITLAAASARAHALLELLDAAEAVQAYEETPEEEWDDADFEERLDELKEATAAAREAVGPRG
jgi:hypothetical protein